MRQELSLLLPTRPPAKLQPRLKMQPLIQVSQVVFTPGVNISFGAVCSQVGLQKQKEVHTWHFEFVSSDHL